MDLNTRIFPTTGYARVLLFMFIRRELGGMVQDVYFSLHTVKYIFGVHRITNRKCTCNRYIYTAIMLSLLSAACVAQWVKHVNIAHLYF